MGLLFNRATTDQSRLDKILSVFEQAEKDLDVFVVECRDEELKLAEEQRRLAALEQEIGDRRGRAVVVHERIGYILGRQ